MEGPSIHLAAEQLRPFVGRRVKRVSGNSQAGIERLEGQRVKAIFAWGKHLVFQLDTTALRVHFLLWGTFAATVRGASVTGDYRRTSAPRLVMQFANGEITIWSSSLKFIDDRDASRLYDFSADVLSDTWDSAAALKKVQRCRTAEIGDVLLDQEDLRRRRQYHQERSPLSDSHEPICKNRPAISSKAEGHHRGRTRVLLQVSGAAPCVRAQEKPRNLRQDQVPVVCGSRQPSSARRAAPAQLLLSRVPEEPGETAAFYPCWVLHVVHRDTNPREGHGSLFAVTYLGVTHDHPADRPAGLVVRRRR